MQDFVLDDTEKEQGIIKFELYHNEIARNQKDENTRLHNIL